jgi:hypothetical protein
MSGLPRNVCRKCDRYYFRLRCKGRETYVRLPSLDDPAFPDALAAAEKQYRREPVDPPLSFRRVRAWTRKDGRYARGEKIPKTLLNAAREARKRAKRRALEFDLSPEQLMVLWKRCQGRCEVSGIRFSDRRGAHLWRPWALSLDRRDCNVGYTFPNIRLVCVCVNAAINQWGDDVFWTMVCEAAKRLRGDENGTSPNSTRIARKAQR